MLGGAQHGRAASPAARLVGNRDICRPAPCSHAAVVPRGCTLPRARGTLAAGPCTRVLQPCTLVPCSRALRVHPPPTPVSVTPTLAHSEGPLMLTPCTPHSAAPHTLLARSHSCPSHTPAALPQVLVLLTPGPCAHTAGSQQCPAHTPGSHKPLLVPHTHTPPARATQQCCTQPSPAHTSHWHTQQDPCTLLARAARAPRCPHVHECRVHISALHTHPARTSTVLTSTSPPPAPSPCTPCTHPAHAPFSCPSPPAVGACTASRPGTLSWLLRGTRGCPGGQARGGTCPEQTGGSHPTKTPPLHGTPTPRCTPLPCGRWPRRAPAPGCGRGAAPGRR